MKRCRFKENDLYLFAYNLLDEKKKIKIENHLSTCKSCKAKVEKLCEIKSMFNNIPKYKAPSQIETILKEARERERSVLGVRRFLSDLKEKIQYLKEIIIANLIYRLELKLAFAVVICALLIYSVLYFSTDKVYFTKVAGIVKINGEYVDLEKKYKFKLNKRLNIVTENGNCIIQINNDKMFVINTHTDIILSKKENINIKLVKGEFLGKVCKSRKRLIIDINDIKIAVIGTRFYAAYLKDEIIKFGILEGKSKVYSGEKEFFLKQNDLLSKKYGNLVINKLSQKIKAKFNVFNIYELINNFDNWKLVKITTKPKNLTIYDKTEIMGYSPLSFFMKKGLKKDLLLYKKGYLPHKIRIDGYKDEIYNLTSLQKRLLNLTWKFYFKKEILLPLLNYKESLIITDINGVIYNLDLKSRNILWKYKIKEKISSSFVAHKDIIFIFSIKNFLYALDFNTGKLKWKRNVGPVTYSSAVIKDDNIYFGDTDGNLWCINVFNGHSIWKMKLKYGFYCSPEIKNNVLYIGDIKGNFYAIDILNRKIIWKYKALNKIVGIKPQIKNNIVYFGSSDKYLYALDINNGNLIWKFETNGEIVTPPVLLNDIIIITSLKGGIYGINPLDGELIWKYNAGSKILLPPLVYENSYIFVGDEDNNIYMFDRYGILIEKLHFNYSKNFTLYKKNLLITIQNSFIYNYSFNF